MIRWLFDLGNTRLKWAMWRDGTLEAASALAHAEPGFEPTLDRALAGLPRAHGALLASVAAPDLAARVSALCHRHGVPCHPVRSLAECAGVRVAYTDPDSLGVDRFLALLAARRRGPGPWLLISVGTALTVDLLAVGGDHRGGLIAPSPKLMRQALAQCSERLEVPAGSACAWGRSTAEAIAGGVESAALGLIERSHALACEALGTAPAVLLTGGGAPALLGRLRPAVEFVPDLVLEGLAAYAATLPENGSP